jgi:hypothetical protein
MTIDPSPNDVTVAVNSLIASHLWSGAKGQQRGVVAVAWPRLDAVGPSVRCDVFEIAGIQDVFKRKNVCYMIGYLRFTCVYIYNYIIYIYVAAGSGNIPSPFF